MKASLLLSFVVASLLLSSCAQTMPNIQTAQVKDPQNPNGANQVYKAPTFTPSGPGDLLAANE